MELKVDRLREERRFLTVTSLREEEGFQFSLQLFLFIMGITKLILCEEKCTTPHITDEQIHDWSVKAINHVLQNKDEIIDNLTVLLNQLMNQSELEFEIETLTKQLENIHQQVVDLVGQNAKVTQSQKDYHETYQKLVEQYEQCEKQQQQKISSRLLKNNRVKELKGFINELKQQEELLTTFDEQLFNTFVEKIEIHQEKSVTITLKNGEAISM